MTLTFRVVNSTIKGLTRMLCRVDDTQLRRVPERGPLIIAANHINFLEVPLVYTHLLPRPVTGLVKAETWDNPAMGALFSLWKGIPVQRGEADKQALRKALDALGAGQIVAVSPEGTRSGDGKLNRGHPGIVLLALHSGSPILPLAYYGGELFQRNLAHFRRTDFHIVVGQPFYLDTHWVRVTRQVRQQITDEIMYQVAALLPPDYRGEYSDLTQATQTYLHFDPSD